MSGLYVQYKSFHLTEWEWLLKPGLILDGTIRRKTIIRPLLGIHTYEPVQLGRASPLFISF